MANYDTCSDKDKVIMVDDDDKVLLPPPAKTDAAAAADQKEPWIFSNIIFVYSVCFLNACIFICIFSLLCTVFWASLYPDTSYLPKFEIQSVLTTPILNTSLSQSPPKISNVDFNFTFSFTKGFDGATILYNFDSVSLYYDGMFLTNTTLTPFFQGPKEQLTVEDCFAVGPSSGVDEWLVNAMVEERRRSGVVEVAVEVEAMVMIGPDPISNWQKKELLVRVMDNKKRWVKITCKGVKVIFSSNSTSGGILEKGPKDCKFQMDVS